MTCIDVTIPPVSDKPRPLVLVVAAALIDADGRILITDRPAEKSWAGYWEFPGGKINPGETPEQALVRELKEELDITTSIGCLAPLAFASHTYEEIHVLMPLFACRVWQGTPRAQEGQKLAWTRVNELKNYKLLPADLPLIETLRTALI